jgi:hypothetical protein
MGPWSRLKRAGRRLFHGRDAAAAGDAADAASRPQRGLTGWVEERAQEVVKRAYETHAGDLEQRAERVMSSVYERSADDMEERAVRAMRKAIEAEAERIKEAIEHAIVVKRREVRLSLLVLVVSSLSYLALYWLTHRPAAP